MSGADDFWEPLPEPCPETLKLQMATLKDWLQRPAILVQQAACLLAGVCPPERDYDDRLFGSYLPGRQEWEIHPDAGRSVLMNKINELKTLLAEAKTAEIRSLADFLRLGADLGEQPPWLEYAILDPECKRLLPAEISGITPTERPIQIANREKAFKKRDQDDGYRLTTGAGRAEFDRLKALGFSGHIKNNGDVIKASLARAIHEAIARAAPDEPDVAQSTRTIERYVSKWLTEENHDNAGALSDNASADEEK